MMTSSNGNIFRVTGPLCGEFTGPSEFPTQRPVTRSFDVFFDLHPNKRLSKQQRGWWFETLSWSLWRHRNVQYKISIQIVGCRLFLCQYLNQKLTYFHLDRKEQNSIWSERKYLLSRKCMWKCCLTNFNSGFELKKLSRKCF